MSFTLIETRQLTALNSTGYLYKHNKTKAQVMFLLNDDDNKAFSISFATPPYNNNGIAHILEHSVLCGSKKYPTKEPFVELAKGSLNTFLNAFTSADKTSYPVASKNDKDFKNLMDVYLDAVFFPLLIDNPLILAQEGWHYHLEKLEDDLIYKGVVYNEMKGAYSDPGTVLYHAAKRALFPDTFYANESGGHPIHIPELTQKEFVDFHQTYYHPSNSFSFIYGKVNIDEQLHHLDTYFSQFDYKSVDKGITYQEPLQKPLEIEEPYSITQDESEENKTFLSLEFVIGESKNIEQYVHYSVLTDILLGSNASPIWKALIESGLGADVEGGINNSLAQTTFDFSLSNSEKIHKDAFKNIIFNTLQQLVENGIDETLIEAAISKNKFAMIESSQQTGYPKGVFYGISATNDWLYDNNPFSVFEMQHILNNMPINSDFYTDLIKKGFLTNQNYILLIGTPQKGLNDTLFTTVHESLQRQKSEMSTDAVNTLIKQTHALLQRQNEPDSIENLATIPLLTLNDLDANITEINLKKTIEHQTTVLTHDTFTGGITYLTYYFDTSAVSPDLIAYIGLFSKLLGHFDTAHYSIDDLANLQDLHTGGISYSTNIFVESTKANRYHPKFVVKAKVFDDKIQWAPTLINEVLLQTNFNHRTKLLEQLLKLKSQHESKFIYQSHMCATYRLRSYYSQSAKYEELLNGIDFYHFLCNLINHFDERFETIVQQLHDIQQTIVSQSNLTIGIITQFDEQNTKHAQIIKGLQQLPQKIDTISKKQPNLSLNNPNEAFIIASDVQYVAKGTNYTLKNLPYNVQLRVLKNIVTYNYLWNEIRVIGGAYGAFNVQTRDGDFLFVSYRDPQISQTIQVFNDASDFVAQLNLSERELTKAIIGTFSELDRPLSAKERGEVAFMRYFMNVTHDEILKERQQILATTNADLQSLATHLLHSINENYCCVFGNKLSIEAQHQLFESITTLIK